MKKSAEEYTEEEINAIEAQACRAAANDLGINPKRNVVILLACSFSLIVLGAAALSMPPQIAAMVILPPAIVAMIVIFRIKKDCDIIATKSEYGKYNYCIQCKEWKPCKEMYLWSDAKSRCVECSEMMDDAIGDRKTLVKFPLEG